MECFGGLLLKHCQARDRLRLIVDYCQKFITNFLRISEDDGNKVVEEYGEVQTRAAIEYEQLESFTAHQKTGIKKPLSGDIKCFFCWAQRI